MQFFSVHNKILSALPHFSRVLKPGSVGEGELHMVSSILIMVTAAFLSWVPKSSHMPPLGHTVSKSFLSTHLQGYEYFISEVQIKLDGSAGFYLIIFGLILPGVIVKWSRYNQALQTGTHCYTHTVFQHIYTSCLWVSEEIVQCAFITPRATESETNTLCFPVPSQIWWSTGFVFIKRLRRTQSNHTQRPAGTKNRHSSETDIGCEWHFHFREIGLCLWDTSFVTEAHILEL